MMGFSFVGLMVSKVLPSLPLTNSLLMNLQIMSVSRLPEVGVYCVIDERTNPAAAHKLR